ncbi:MAG: M23 family metallopeptidase [Bacteroidota bacterium]
MTSLTTQEVDFLADYLEEYSSKTGLLREEFLDHLCCIVETQMSDGQSFKQAAAYAFTQLPQAELQEIEEHTIALLQNNYKMILKISSLTLLILLLTFTGIWAFQYDPPSRAPINGEMHISSAFGWRTHPIHDEVVKHRGIDIKIPIGTPIVSTASGTVIQIEQKKSGYGNLVVIQHDEAYTTRYGQLSEIKVELGQVVKKGEVIALSGNSGASIGPHLHYEVIKDGKAVDPSDYLHP